MSSQTQEEKLFKPLMMEDFMTTKSNTERQNTKYEPTSLSNNFAALQNFEQTLEKTGDTSDKQCQKQFSTISFATWRVRDSTSITLGSAQ